MAQAPLHISDVIAPFEDLANDAVAALHRAETKLASAEATAQGLRTRQIPDTFPTELSARLAEAGFTTQALKKFASAYATDPISATLGAVDALTAIITKQGSLSTGQSIQLSKTDKTSAQSDNVWFERTTH